MADVTIKYKGANIATMDASGTKTLETSGKYCEGDVQVVYADPEKPTQSKTVTPTASGFTVFPDSGKVLSSVVVNGDSDLIASNIRSGKNIFGVDGTLVEGITPSGNKSITATTSTQTGIDVTNYATVSVAPTPSETKSVTANGDVTPSSGKLLSKVTVNVPTGTARSASDLTVSGATVTVPAGLYSAQATKSVASGSAGTPSASKGTVSNNSVTVTPSVTNTTGYITGGTKTGTGVTVSASELVSGNKALTPSTTAQTNIDVKNYATASVSAITKELLASLDADFVAENIKKDVDLFGLIGALEGGGGGDILGHKFVAGSFTLAANTTSNYTIMSAADLFGALKDDFPGATSISDYVHRSDGTGRHYLYYFLGGICWMDIDSADIYVDSSHPKMVVSTFLPPYKFGNNSNAMIYGDNYGSAAVRRQAMLGLDYGGAVMQFTSAYMGYAGAKYNYLFYVNNHGAVE